MSEGAPSRGLVLELREERQSMREGQSFLEEKSLLLAAAIVRELSRYRELREAAEAAAALALAALAAALGHHGLEELTVLPAPDPEETRVSAQRSAVVGVPLIEARVLREAGAGVPLAWSTPEARACRDAFAQWFDASTALGAAAGNLERLSAEYRKSIRRERALADVLIPEIGQRLAAMEAGLEDDEREEAIAMRAGAGSSAPRG